LQRGVIPPPAPPRHSSPPVSPALALVYWRIWFFRPIGNARDPLRNLGDRLRGSFDIPDPIGAAAGLACNPHAIPPAREPLLHPPIVRLALFGDGRHKDARAYELSRVTHRCHARRTTVRDNVVAVERPATNRPELANSLPAGPLQRLVMSPVSELQTRGEYAAQKRRDEDQQAVEPKTSITVPTYRVGQADREGQCHGDDPARVVVTPQWPQPRHDQKHAPQRHQPRKHADRPHWISARRGVVKDWG